MSKAIIVITIIFTCFLPSEAFAADNAINSSDLIDNASEYDGHTFVYTGEVIGDILSRGDYTWLNVSDGSNAIGIWVKSSDIQDVKIAGRYDAHGDTIKITGVFHRACAEHGGDFDIHAEKVELIEKGYTVNHVVKTYKVVLAVILFTAALICIGLVLKKRLCK